MAIADDFSVALNGDIRYTGTTANYTVIEFHRYLGALMDDAAASGDDLLDITNATASARSTDNIITLNEPYNIDWVAAQHLYDGSVVQDGGDTIYDGILVYAPAGTPLQIIQNGAPVSPNFWDTTLNPDATQGISHRFMLLVRSGGADIDGRKLLGQTRENTYTFSAFPINGTARGNNVIALTYASDLNNTTAIGTIEGWTTIDNTTEGYVAIDVDNDTTDEYYYSEWNRAAKTINEFYERHKWLTRESTVLDSSADTGSDFQVGNATITGQAQSFEVGNNDEYLTRVRVKLKKTGSPTGNLTAVLYAHTGTYGTSSEPTGAALATSANFDVSKLTTAYKEYELDFSGDLYLMLNSATYYCIAFELPVIDGSNYVSIEGLASSGTHSGNRSQEVSAAWTPTAADDLDFEVYSSPDVYGLPGEVFRGITHEVALSTGSGTWGTPEHEEVTWSGGTGQLLAVDNKTGASATAMWIQLLTGVAPTNTQVITGTTSGATGTASGTATERTVSTPPVGASTGTAIIGAYGLGIEYDDLATADKVTALDNLVYQTPNNQQFTLGGLVYTPEADRILVAPRGYIFQYYGESSGPFDLGETLTFTSPAGTAYLSDLVDDGDTGWMIVRMLTGDPPEDDGTISGGGSGATANVNGDAVPYQDVRYLKLATTLNSDPETQVVCTAAIPTWLPTTGSIRIQMDSGLYRRIAYSSYASTTFTISGTENFSADPATGGSGETGNSIYPSPLDQAATSTSHSFTGTYTADIDLFFRVRDGQTTPIKTSEGIATFGSGGGSATATRISDE